MTDPDDRQPFAAFLAAYQRGQLNSQLGDDLAELVAAVAEHGKKGELNLKVTVKPAGANAGAQLLVACETTFKPPKPTPPEQIFWADDDGQLLRNDPNATPLFDEESLR